MEIYCLSCKQVMTLAEFLTYPASFFIKAATPFLVQFFIDALRNYTLSGTRGPVDATMAGLANNFDITCPGCKQKNTWSTFRHLHDDKRQIVQSDL